MRNILISVFILTFYLFIKLTKLNIILEYIIIYNIIYS